MKQMTYDEARLKIKSGDVVNMYRYSKGLMPFLHGFIQFFTGSKLYHSVVAVWMKSPSGIERLMCVETNLLGGKRIVPLSIYAKMCDMEVIHLPSAYKFESMEPAAMRGVGSEPYGLWNLVTIGLREFFGMKVKDPKGQVCSELVAELLVEAGVPLIDTHVSPGALRNEMIRLGMEPEIFIPVTK